MLYDNILIFFKRFANRFGSLALPDFIEEKFFKFCCHTFIQSRGSHFSLVNADVANWEKISFYKKLIIFMLCNAVLY